MKGADKREGKRERESTSDRETEGLTDRHTETTRQPDRQTQRGSLVWATPGSPGALSPLFM